LNAGALSLILKFVEERKVENKEAVLAALGSFLSGTNYEAK